MPFKVIDISGSGDDTMPHPSPPVVNNNYQQKSSLRFTAIFHLDNLIFYIWSLYFHSNKPTMGRIPFGPICCPRRTCRKDPARIQNCDAMSHSSSDSNTQEVRSRVILMTMIPSFSTTTPSYQLTTILQKTSSISSQYARTARSTGHWVVTMLSATNASVTLSIAHSVENQTSSP